MKDERVERALKIAAVVDELLESEDMSEIVVEALLRHYLYDVDHTVGQHETPAEAIIARQAYALRRLIESTNRKPLTEDEEDCLFDYLHETMTAFIATQNPSVVPETENVADKVLKNAGVLSEDFLSMFRRIYEDDLTDKEHEILDIAYTEWETRVDAGLLDFKNDLADGVSFVQWQLIEKETHKKMKLVEIEQIRKSNEAFFSNKEAPPAPHELFEDFAYHALARPGLHNEVKALQLRLMMGGAEQTRLEKEIMSLYTVALPPQMVAEIK